MRTVVRGRQVLSVADVARMRMMARRITTVLSFAGSCILAPAIVFAQSDLTQIRPPEGATNAAAHDINNRREIVGWFGTPDDGMLGIFVHRPGRRIRTFRLGLVQSVGSNDRGDIVGTQLVGEDPDWTRRHFIIRRGRSIQYLNDVDGRVTTINDINSQGTMIGTMWEQDDPYDWDFPIHGVVLSHGRLAVIDNPWGFPVTDPAKIANDGTIVGSFGETFDGIRQGFICRKDEWAVVNYPGAINTQLTGIGSDGWIVGIAALPDGWRGFVYRDGTFHDIGSNLAPYGGTLDPVLSNLAPQGVNASGWIAGYVAGYIPDGTFHYRAYYTRLRF